MKLKQAAFTVLLSALTCFGIMWGYGKYVKSQNTYGGQLAGVVPVNYGKYVNLENGNNNNGPGDFTAAAEASMNGVVHIVTKTAARQTSNQLPRMQSPFGGMFDDETLEQFFGGGSRSREQRASGSGVLISDDGYIVTNNHVVAGADEVKVTLANKRSYTAKVIGTDPTYDLAVVKIEASKLPYVLYGNSDDTKIGQWVLAIGYPLNLDATVTAGIISAKSRTLGLNRDRSGDPGIESFIQTDAAVNQGNSGGALVNSTNGALLGINSAIASPTGYYSGYSYAIPVNIVKKVVDDIIRYGTVQRAYIGIQYADATGLSETEKERAEIPKDAWGIIVTGLPKDGGASAAGIRIGDQITRVNNIVVSSGAEMQEQVSRYKPGDRITVTYLRGGKEMTANVQLKNISGNYDVVKADAGISQLGAELASLSTARAREYGISGGVLVKRIIKDGVIDKQSRMKDGFVIMKANGKSVATTDQLKAAIATDGSVTVTGFYPGYDGMWEYNLNLQD